MTSMDNSMVSLRFSGVDLNPEELSLLLKYPSNLPARPTFKTRRVKSNAGLQQEGIWSLSYGQNDPSEIEFKIVTLLNRLTDDLKVWDLVADKYSGDIFCGLFLDGWNRSFELSTKLISMLADRKLTIGFDIYAPIESWEGLESNENHTG